MHQQIRDYEELLNLPVWQMTGRELKSLILADTPVETAPKTATTVAELSTYLGCSPSLLNNLVRCGALKGAVVSRVGRAYTFDIEKARQLANAYQKKRRGY